MMQKKGDMLQEGHYLPPIQQGYYLIAGIVLMADSLLGLM
jgi:hypothetical protein